MTAPSEAVRTWTHSRKGRIRGVEIGGDETWMRVRLVGDHTLRYLSISNSGRVDKDGSIIQLRRTFMKLIEVES